jgi:hypothetical protein
VPGFTGAFLMVRPTNKMTSRHVRGAVEQVVKSKIVLQKKGK